MKKHFHKQDDDSETSPDRESSFSNNLINYDTDKEEEVRHFVPKEEKDVGGEKFTPDVAVDVEEDIQPSAGYTLYLRDGVSRVDMILCYVHDDDKALEVAKHAKRVKFQKNLVDVGLVLEVEAKEKSIAGKTTFVKVHAPKEALQNTLEPLNIKMPIKEDPLQKEKSDSFGPVKRMFSYNKIRVGDPPKYIMSPYSKERDEQFLDIETMLTPAQRSQIVWSIMLRAKYGDQHKIGIRRLVNDKVYAAAYPLHEGRYDRDAADGTQLDRRKLYLEWARPSKWYKKQPMWLIKRYFGEHIGLYFAWLGFYTTMLIPAAIVGLIVFIYGLASMGTPDNIPSSEICDLDVAGRLMLCPTCDRACDYVQLSDSCFFAKMTYLFDNPATVFFAVFMSFWATTFLELWKRRQKVLEWKWNLTDIEDDLEPRLEYEAKADKGKFKKRKNPLTGKEEAYVPFWSRALRYTTTVSMVLFMGAVVIAALLGTIIYRISVLSVIYSSTDELLAKNAKIISSSTAALINLVIIIILTVFYKWLAEWMVNLENPRTQSEFEDSYTFKIYIFQFVNYYSSLIYIAFFKGRFFIQPGDAEARQTGILQLRSDVCDPTGCLAELFIQLAIVMVGKQAFDSIMQIFLPYLMNSWRRRKEKKFSAGHTNKMTSWEEDLRLGEVGRLALFEEYLEMVLQYGFVTLFVAAFPLAPLFALINNIWEIRLDGYKMLVQTKRRVAHRVKDIGAWYGILQGITYAAVVFNGFVVAFTSEFIPRLVYQLAYSDTSDLRGYVQFSLSAFNTSDYGEGMGPDTDVHPEVCYYRGFRNGPEDENKYGISTVFFHIMMARFAFIVVFEHVVFSLTGLMANLIPDVPADIKLAIHKEKLQVTEAKYNYMDKARAKKVVDGWIKPDGKQEAQKDGGGARRRQEGARRQSKEEAGVRKQSKEEAGARRPSKEEAGARRQSKEGARRESREKTTTDAGFDPDRETRI